jgi:hypothetical protein
VSFTSVSITLPAVAGVEGNAFRHDRYSTVDANRAVMATSGSEQALRSDADTAQDVIKPQPSNSGPLLA